MQIRFADITTTGNRYEFETPFALCDDDGVSCQALHVRCVLRKKDETHAELSGHVRATVSVLCDRCLASFKIEIDKDIELLLESEDKGHWQVRDLECSIADLDTLVLDTPYVDLEDIFRQQILLALPVRLLCSMECRGLCSQCGANLNEETCQCTKTSGNSPFAALAILKKKL